MERSKLKLTVIFLLTVLDLFLLGSVLMQCHQSRDYARTTQTQILVYLERNGIEVQQETIPWESGLSARREDLADQILPDSEWPAQGLPDNCEVQPPGSPPRCSWTLSAACPSWGRPVRRSTGFRRAIGTAARRTGRFSPPCGRLRPTRGPFCWTVPRGF